MVCVLADKKQRRIMKELKFKKDTPQGRVDILLRVMGKLVYFRIFNSVLSNQAIAGGIEQLKQKGAIIIPGLNWIKIDMFSGFQQDNFIIGGRELNIKAMTENEVENILVEFFLSQYIKAGFENVSA